MSYSAPVLPFNVSDLLHCGVWVDENYTADQPEQWENIYWFSCLAGAGRWLCGLVKPKQYSTNFMPHLRYIHFHITKPHWSILCLIQAPQVQCHTAWRKSWHDIQTENYTSAYINKLEKYSIEATSLCKSHLGSDCIEVNCVILSMAESRSEEGRLAWVQIKDFKSAQYASFRIYWSLSSLSS